MTFGLEHVTFAVAAGTQDGSIRVSIVTGDSTQVLDVNGDLLPFDTSDGTITVSTSAVPEPSTMVMGLAAAVAGLIVGRLRRR